MKNNKNVEFRMANEVDAKAIESIARIIWNEHYITIITQEQINYMLHLMYSETSIKEQMKRGCEFTLLFVDQELMGYLSIEESIEEPGHFFMHKFYIHQKVRRTGVGEELFKFVIDKKNSIKELRLFVNRQNYKAINFYFKMGFVIEKVIDQPIGDGFFMNDFVMLKGYS